MLQSLGSQRSVDGRAADLNRGAPAFLPLLPQGHTPRPRPDLTWRRVGPPYEAEAPTPLHPAITWGPLASSVTRLSRLSPWCVWARACGSTWLG